MKRITLLFVAGVFILFTACVHTTNIKRIENQKPNNIGVISFFTNEVKGTFGKSGHTVYSKDTGWMINNIVKASVEQKHKYGKVYSIDFDLSSVQKKDEEKYGNLSQAVVGKFLHENQDTDIDLFLVFYPNAIDEWGRQHSALMNFGLMGPIGVLIGEHARNTGTYTPIINIYRPYNFEIAFGEKARCQLNYNLYAIDRHSQQIIGQKENVKCVEKFESDFWPSENLTFEELDLPYIKEKCVTAISKSLSQSLSDIGL